jgi:hypothetical protein
LRITKARRASRCDTNNLVRIKSAVFGEHTTFFPMIARFGVDRR